MNVKWAVLFGVFFFTGCNGAFTSSADILGKKKMQDVLWDIVQAEVYTKKIIQKDSTKNSAEENVKLQQQIFSKHNITKEDFYSSYQYYQQHPSEMQSILDSIVTVKRQVEIDRYMKPLKKL